MRRTLAVAVLALWALVGLPGSAQAGGPTSVLITQPGTGQATALYYDAGEYAELERLLTSGAETAAKAPMDSGGTQYTMTWMIHDVTPWRIDAVHVASDGTASVSTDIVMGSEQEGTQSGWRAVTDGEKLVALLDRVFSGDPSAAAREQVADETPAVAPAVPAASATEWFSLTGWRWAVPGLLGGLVIGLLAARRRAPAEPHRVLLDMEPEHART